MRIGLCVCPMYWEEDSITRLKRVYYLLVGILKPLLLPYQIRVEDDCCSTSEVYSISPSLRDHLPHLFVCCFIAAVSFSFDDNQCTDATWQLSQSMRRVWQNCMHHHHILFSTFLVMWSWLSWSRHISNLRSARDLKHVLLWIRECRWSIKALWSEIRPH